MRFRRAKKQSYSVIFSSSIRSRNRAREMSRGLSLTSIYFICFLTTWVMVDNSSQCGKFEREVRAYILFFRVRFLCFTLSASLFERARRMLFSSFAGTFTRASLVNYMMFCLHPAGDLQELSITCWKITKCPRKYSANFKSEKTKSNWNMQKTHSKRHPEGHLSKRHFTT